MIVLKTMLKFILKQLRHVSVQSQYVALFGIRLLPKSATYTHQQGPTNIYSHITTELTTHRCTIIGYFNKCNFNKHE
jgi:thiamine phosphate synthase YjbQ (UPF0047 family)